MEILVFVGILSTFIVVELYEAFATVLVVGSYSTFTVNVPLPFAILVCSSYVNV